jgi:hypothetical protein
VVNANDPGEDKRPWEQPGAVRRDCQPHRGNMLILLGAVGATVGALGIVLFVPAVVALVVGIITYREAKRDLAEMKAGRMDPGGRSRVLRAQDLGVTSITVGAAGTIWFAAILLLRPWEW